MHLGRRLPRLLEYLARQFLIYWHFFLFRFYFFSLAILRLSNLRHFVYSPVAFSKRPVLHPRQVSQQRCILCISAAFIQPASSVSQSAVREIDERGPSRANDVTVAPLTKSNLIYFYLTLFLFLSWNVPTAQWQEVVEMDRESIRQYRNERNFPR